MMRGTRRSEHGRGTRTACAAGIVVAVLGLVAILRGTGDAEMPLSPDAPVSDSRDATDGVVSGVESPAVRTAVAAAFVARVVDEDGEPAADAVVRLGELVATADRDGVLRFTAAAPDHQVDIHVESAAFALVTPSAWRPRAMRGTDLTIVVRRRAALEGRVVFADDGLPVAGIELIERTGAGFGTRARTDAAGRFRWFGDHAPGTPTRIEVVDPGPCVGIAALDAAWGDTAVQVALSRAGRVRVLVVGSDDGEPVEQFRVRIRPLHAHETIGATVGERGPHVGGTATVFGAWPGANDLQILSDDPRYQSSEVVTIQVRAGDTPELPIALERRRAIDVVVRNDIGLPVAGIPLQWVDTRGRGAVGTIAERDEDVALRPAWLRQARARIAFEAESGDDGLAATFVAPTLEAPRLVVRYGRSDKEKVVAAFADGGSIPDQVEVTVPARARVRGRITPPPVSSWRPAVVMRRSARASGNPLRDAIDTLVAQARIAADGSFEFAPVAGGAFRLELDVRAEGSGTGRTIGFLKSLVVAGGEDVTLELDGRAFASASLRGRVPEVDPADEVHVELYGVGHPSPLATAKVGADGRFEFPEIWPMQRALLRVRGGPFGEGAWHAGGPLLIQPGATIAQDVVLGTATLEIALTRPTGELVRAAVSLQREGDVWPGGTHVRLDPHGQAVVRHLVPGIYSVRFLGAEGLSGSGLGQIELSAGAVLRFARALR